MSIINRSSPRSTNTEQHMFLVPTHIKTINTYLPMELLREIFLYSMESNHLKSGQLASVCRHWRSVITGIASLWSTLRVDAWTEKERVSTWLQRAYPKKIVIDTRTPKGHKERSKPLAINAIENALTDTEQWHELTIFSLPRECDVIEDGIRAARPMKVLKVLHIAAECAHTPTFAHFLNLVPIEAPLCELRLHSPIVSAHFLQPHWLPVLQNLTVLIISGKNIDGQFEFLPTFTRLQIFEANHLRLPFYEPNTNLPLLCTLRKVRLRACSIQWMAGRQFPCLEECAILLPRHWEVIQQHEVQFPSCKTLTYHGYPMTTAQYFHVPEMRKMNLISHDCNDQRVYRHLRHLCRVNGRISNLTTLHLTFQCSEQVLIKVLKYLVPLQELVLSIAHPSSSWQSFLELLAAKPSIKEWPAWNQWMGNHQKLEQWCSSQTWNANSLPHLKYLGIQCPKGFSQSERLDNSPLLRLVGWTRTHLTSPLEHLEVWRRDGSMGDTAVEYISTHYLDRRLGISGKAYDAMIVMGMVTRHLVIHDHATPLLKLHSTALFRQLQHLELICNPDYEIPILPYLEQIKKLEIWRGVIPGYPLNLDLPLTHTLQWLELRESTFYWMLGRTFKALREFQNHWSPLAPESLSKHKGLQVDLPACTTLEFGDCPIDSLRFLSCSNVQDFRWRQLSACTSFDLPALKSLRDFVLPLSCLQNLYIFVPQALGVDSLMQFVFCGAGVWRDIRSVGVRIEFNSSSEASHFFYQTVGDQQRYEKWWKTFTVTKEYAIMVAVNASM
jgi:hypothetical protein